MTTGEIKVPEFMRELASSLPMTLTKEEACKVLRISRITIERAINAGKLHIVKAGSSRSSRVIITRSELLRYMVERAQ